MTEHYGTRPIICMTENLFHVLTFEFEAHPGIQIFC